MNIYTFQQAEYRGCPIYYRNFLHHFEYLTVIKGQIYTAHVTVIPTLINRILCALKIEPVPYSVQQKQKIIFHLRRMATTTIDFVLDDKNKKK